MAQSPAGEAEAESIGDYLKNWDALSSMLTRGRSFSGRERNCAFLNLGSDDAGGLRRFADVSAVSGLDSLDDGRAVVATDWDRDGDLDFWFTNRQGPRLRFVKNQLGDAQGKNSIAFELEGTSCNRDAIGAVLQFEIDGRKLTRTLTAGDGFMSQSGKRVHFGLGEVEDGVTGTLSVNWPGGVGESFDKVNPGGFYRIVQGAGMAQSIEAGEQIKVASESVVASAPTEQARIILSHRIASPPLNYVDFRGDLQKHEPDPTGNGAPVLINLWASWCAPCRSELEDLRAHHKQLEAKGLRVTALTVEGIPRGDEKPDVAGAKDFIARSNFPFQVGAISIEGMRLLTLLHDRVVVRQRPLPLPSSFLIDKYGRLAAIYKGPVSAEQLLADLDLLDADAKTLADHAFPFPARDGTNLFPLGALDFARAYLAGDDAEAARREARKVAEAPLTNNAQTDLANRARSWYFIGTLEQGQRNWRAAAEAYQTALDFSPGQVLLKIPLGVVLWQADANDEADRTFAEAASEGATNPAVMDALGKAHLQIRRYEEAVPFFEKAIALAQPGSQYELGLALAHQTGGNTAEAIRIYREFLDANPSSANAKNNLASLLATAPEDKVRDGELALKLAREIVAQTGDSSPSPLDTLAVALAETGDFKGAIEAANRAITAARATGRNDLLPKLRKKLALYQDEIPYRLEEKK